MKETPFFFIRIDNKRVFFSFFRVETIQYRSVFRYNQLTAGGFEVHDLGVNIRAEEFLGAVDRFKADILAMSALLTMTASEQRKIIEALKERGIRDKVKVMVDGGAITQEFADEIGADGYDPTAPGAVTLAKRLLGK